MCYGQVSSSCLDKERLNPLEIWYMEVWKQEMKVWNFLHKVRKKTNCEYYDTNSFKIDKMLTQKAIKAQTYDRNIK